MADSNRGFGDINECGRALGVFRACPLAANLGAFLMAVNGLRADLAAHGGTRHTTQVPFRFENPAGISAAGGLVSPVGMREAMCEVRLAEAALALANVLSAQASGAAPEVIALLQAQSSLASLCAEQAADLLGPCTAHPVAANGASE